MKNLLSSSAFLIVNKKLAKTIGLLETILLADLISKEEYFIDNKLIENGWFFNTEANIENDTTLNSYHQRKCLKTLKKHKIIEIKRKGIPAKLYFKINTEQVMQILNNLSFKNSTTINNNKEIKTNNNRDINIFKLEVKDFDTTEEHKKEFLEYWLEESRSGKTKYEMQKTWDTKRRLTTWIKNHNKWWAKKTGANSKIDEQLNEYLKGKEFL